MNTGTFEPSLDWSREPINSALWVLEVFAITAVVVFVILALLRRYTGWGRQFWRITGSYYSGPQSIPVWATLAVLLLLTVVSVRINVLLTYYVNDLFTAVQVAFQGGSPDGEQARQSGISGFWSSMVIFGVLATCYIVRMLLDMYVTQRYIMRWRIWLSHHFIGDWLGDFAYFRSQFSRRPIDNPDQRIQQDIDSFTTGVGGEPNNPMYTSAHTLLFGAIEAVLSVLSFGTILWQLSGSVTLGDWVIPRALFWIVFVYVFIATIIAFAIGRPLIKLSYLNELRNAGFRYALVRVRDAGAAIAMYRGEKAERRLLAERLAAVMDNYRNWLHRMLLFFGWNVTVSQAINPLPWIVQAQSLFAQRLTFGDVWQSSIAFAAIHDSLSFFRNAYDQFASYRAVIIRLDGLIEQNRAVRQYSSVASSASPAGLLEVDAVEVRNPDGRVLVDDLEFTLDAGDALLVRGPSGVGKTLLLQSLAGLWPFASGHVRLPCDRHDVMFVPQLPYLPLGDLRAVVSYPLAPGVVSDTEIQLALVKVCLPDLVIRLGECLDWAKALSVGEQQRIGFARILLSRPRVVFLDEATSAVDDTLESVLYELLRSELPDAAVVSVGHRASLGQFHTRELTLVGDGQWRLQGLAVGG